MVIFSEPLFPTKSNSFLNFNYLLTDSSGFLSVLCTHRLNFSFAFHQSRLPEFHFYILTFSRYHCIREHTLYIQMNFHLSNWFLTCTRISIFFMFLSLRYLQRTFELSYYLWISNVRKIFFSWQIMDMEEEKSFSALWLKRILISRGK